jgi:hypothetical protein
MGETTLYSSHVQIFCADDGWRYRGLQPLDFYQRTFPALAEMPSFGPFVSPEAAAYAAIEGLGLTDGDWLEPLVPLASVEPGAGRAAAALIVGLEPRRGTRAAAAKELAPALGVSRR